MHGSRRLYLKPVLLIGALFLWVGCWGAAGIRVSQVPMAGFSGTQTWSFIPSSFDSDRDPSVEERELSRRVRERIRIELGRRGLRYRAKGADLEIDARLEIREEKRVVYERAAMETLSTFHNGVNYEIEATQRRVETRHHVRLMIRAVDRRHQNESWRASYEGNDREWSIADVDDVVEATLASFPDVSAGIVMVVDAREVSERESLVPRE